MSTSLDTSSLVTSREYRIGSVPYLNAVPLTQGIESKVVFEPPSKLANLLERGELDAGLGSVTAVLMSERYSVADGMAIASLGEVKSVLLGYRAPLESVQEVFCDQASLTSIQLLRVLLAEKGLHPEFKALPQYGSPDVLPDYVLLIGDPALDFLFTPSDFQVWDLGAAWMELTGLPFVYAVWALQRDADNRELCHLLREARDFGLDTLDHIVRHRSEFTYQFRKDYLTWHIHYHLGEDEKRGLAVFLDLLRKHSSQPVFAPIFVR
jgi:chorismate dehydratase